MNATFRDLRQDIDLSDVTLVGEDNKQITAHKVILVASSSVFSDMLKQNKHPDGGAMGDPYQSHPTPLPAPQECPLENMAPRWRRKEIRSVQ